MSSSGLYNVGYDIITCISCSQLNFGGREGVLKIAFIRQSAEISTYARAVHNNFAMAVATRTFSGQ